MYRSPQQGLRYQSAGSNYAVGARPVAPSYALSAAAGTARGNHRARQPEELRKGEDVNVPPGGPSQHFRDRSYEVRLREEDHGGVSRLREVYEPVPQQSSVYSPLRSHSAQVQKSTYSPPRTNSVSQPLANSQRNFQSAASAHARFASQTQKATSEKATYSHARTIHASDLKRSDIYQNTGSNLQPPPEPEDDKTQYPAYTAHRRCNFDGSLLGQPSTPRAPEVLVLTPVGSPATHGGPRLVRRKSSDSASCEALQLDESLQLPASMPFRSTSRIDPITG